MRDNPNGKAGIVLAGLVVVFGGGAAVFLGSGLVYAGVKALYTRRIPFTKTSNLTGLPAQIGAVFFIIAGVFFVLSVAGLVLAVTGQLQ